MRLVLLAVLPLAACVAEGPMVSDYNGHMAKVISHPYALGDRWRESPITAKAKEACGREVAYQGTRQINEFQGEHSFLCR